MKPEEFIEWLGKRITEIESARSKITFKESPDLVIGKGGQIKGFKEVLDYYKKHSRSNLIERLRNDVNKFFFDPFEATLFVMAWAFKEKSNLSPQKFKILSSREGAKKFVESILKS